MSLAWVKSTIPAPIRHRLRQQRELLADARMHPGLALMRAPLLSRLIAAVIKPRDPPILLVSLPRGGSSWVGGILGSAKESLYLREPLTQAYLKLFGQKAPPFFEWAMCRNQRSYDRFARLAFNGIPRFGRTMVPFAGQWRLASRRRRRVVIKEVNPLVLNRLRERFRPRVVLLVRHPAPVARSFHALGWTGDQLSTRFAPETLNLYGDLPAADRYWEQAGAAQAIAQNLALEALGKTDHLIVRYEDVCRHPPAAFERIFEFCGLKLDPGSRNAIEKSARSRLDYAPGSYDTRRNSRSMADRWRSEMTAEEIAAVKSGYLSCSPVFYREEADW